MSLEAIHDTLNTFEPAETIKVSDYREAYPNKLDPRKILAGQIIRLYMYVDGTFIAADTVTISVSDVGEHLLVCQAYLDGDRNKKSATFPINEQGLIVPQSDDTPVTAGFMTVASRDSPIDLIEIEAASLYERCGLPPAT